MVKPAMPSNPSMIPEGSGSPLYSVGTKRRDLYISYQREALEFREQISWSKFALPEGGRVRRWAIDSLM